eukprot:2700380-Pleurochrysis_carterae.AAC.1
MVSVRRLRAADQAALHGVHQRLHLMPRLRRHPIGSSEDGRHTIVRCETDQKIDLRVESVR